MGYPPTNYLIDYHNINNTWEQRRRKRNREGSETSALRLPSNNNYSVYHFLD
jgi:hypothetical protein